MGMTKWNVSSPGAIITMAVLAFIAVKLATIMIPLLTESVVELGGIDNFTFASLFNPIIATSYIGEEYRGTG